MSSTPVEAPNSLVSNTYIRILDVLCEGPIKGFVVNSGQYGADPLTSMYYDNVNVRNLDGSYNFNVSGQGYNVFFTLGTTGQAAMSGFGKVENIIPLSSNNQITNPPPGAGNVKNVTTTFSTTMYPDADSIKVSVSIPALFTQDNDGNTNGFVINYAVDISLNNGPFANVDEIEINGKCTSPYTFTTLYVLPKTTPPQSFYQWTVRIRKTNVDILSVLTQNTIFIQSIGVISNNTFNYPNTALVGTFIAADQFTNVPTRTFLMDGLLVSVPLGYTPTLYDVGGFATHYCDVTAGAANNIGITSQDPAELSQIVTGMIVNGPGIPGNSVVTAVNFGGPGNYNFGINQAPTATQFNNLLSFYSTTGTITPVVAATYPNVWYGQFQSGVWTDNPAWIFYDILTNTRYGLGNYIDPALVDKWSLYAIAQYCDELVDNGQGDGGLEPRFSCNVNITSADDAYNFLLNMTSVFRGMMYSSNGSIFATQTSDKTPVYNYTNANVLAGQFSYADTARNTRSTVANVRWTDPNSLYRENVAYVEDTQGIIRYGYVVKEAAAFACTSPGQAYRLGQWILQTEQLLTETVSFRVGLEGIFLRPGDVFNVYDNFRNNQNQGGRVVSFDPTLTTITLDRPVTIQPGYNYTLSAVIPAFTLDATGSVTGSNEIPWIHNSQIETIAVTTTPGTGLNQLTVNSAFTTGLFAGSPWILSVSGLQGTIFNTASIYQCVSTAEVEPGIIEVIGLQYNTGLYTLVENTVNIAPNPINSGDHSPIVAPSQFSGQLVTGIWPTSNQFYQYLQLTWLNSPSTNEAYYVISGDNGGGPSAFVELGTTNGTGFTYQTPVTGAANFTLQAVSQGGVYSSPVPLAFTFPQVPGLDPAQIRVWMLPAGFGDLEQLAVFYNRPSPTVESTRVFYATSPAGPFTERLDQSFYPAIGTTASGFTTSGSTLYFHSTSFDMPTFFSQGTFDQANNQLLFLVENELMSVGQISGLQFGSQYAATVNRGVLGTFVNTHAANLSGWLFFADDLNSFSDPTLVSVFNATGYDTGAATRYFQIQNSTLDIDGAVTPTPAFAYTIPNPLPNAPTNLSGYAPGGNILRLTWVGPQNLDILQYHLYRLTQPFTGGYTLISSDTSSFFDDINVVPGTGYRYFVTTEATNDQESPASNIVQLVPTSFFPPGTSPYPPADPTAATFISGSNYLTKDGSLLATLTFSVPAQGSGAAYTNLLYKIHANGSLQGATIGGQTTGNATQLITIFDLAPGTVYNVGTQAISNFGVFSNDITTATSSPFTAPSSQATAGVPGSPPATPTNFHVSGGLLGTANFIALNWAPNQEVNLEEYGVYRSISPAGQAALPIAYAGTNSYVDATVVGGITYTYWVSAFNRSEQESTSAAGPVNGSVLSAPASPGTATLASSGYYLSSDGNVMNSLTFSVPALPTNAVGQYLLYSTGNSPSAWTVANDLANNGTVLAPINDLTPGTLYSVGLQAYSIHGVPTAVIPANPATYVAYGKGSTLPAQPSSLVIGPTTVQNSVTIPPVYSTFAGQPALAPAVSGTWIASTDNDIAFYEWDMFSSAPSNGQPINYKQTVPATQLYAFTYQPPLPPGSLPVYFLWVRSINKVGNVSNWAISSNGTRGDYTYAGNLGSQNANATNLSQVQVSDPTLTTSPTKSAVIQQIIVNPATVITHGATVNNIDYSISVVGLGFNTIPEVGTINLDGGTHGAAYRYARSAAIVQSSPITGVCVTIYRFDGTADITDGEQFFLNCYFQENF